MDKNITLETAGEDVWQQVTENLCEGCHRFQVCHLRHDKNALKQHYVVNDIGAFACDMFLPIEIEFVEENFTQEQKDILKKLDLKFGKKYMLIEIKDAILELDSAIPSS